jgi:uncharacterized membrane protein
MVNPDISVYPRIATPVAVVGSSIVFLLALAALGNMIVLQNATPPPALRQGVVIAHLATVLLALPLGVSQLVLPKGTMRHRIVGYIWCALMTITAIVSFSVHVINPGHLSLIHIFSVMTLVFIPPIILFARAGNVARHQRSVLGLMLGSLVIAGLFTFVPGRVLGDLVQGWFR